MRKILNILASVALLATLALSFTACSDDDNDQRAYFTFGVAEMSISGSQTDLADFYDYLNEVSDAYYSALGMSETQNSVIIDGDYKSIRSEMRTKFDGAKLPAAPELGIKYSFKMVLRGCDLSKEGNIELEDMDIVASKTFAN